MASMPHLLFLSPMKKGCGNHYTTQRISSHLKAARYRCSICDPKEFEDKAGLEKYVKAKNVKVIVALHAYKSGRLLVANFPYILIFGGTDLNECDKDEDKLRVMTKAVIGARYLVGFSNAMLNRALEIWPFLDRQRCCIIRQGVRTNPSSFSIKDKLYDSGKITKDQFFQAKIFLFVGGIRQVKDPMYLVDIFAEWHKADPNVLYVILGPVIEEDYHEKLLTKLNGLDGIIYMNELSQEDTHACMRQSFSLVNSSISEGMAAVILEAMDLCIPVIARQNDGNCSLISNGNTGFIYNTPQEFKEKAILLLSNPDRYREVTEDAKSYVASHHSADDERLMYQEIVRNYEIE